MPAWLALAVSYTNDGNRAGAYEAIQEWIERNDHYKNAVQAFRSSKVLDESTSQADRFDNLIECLITMARSDTSGEIDADIQVALAILMNTNEVGCPCMRARFVPLSLFFADQVSAPTLGL